MMPPCNLEIIRLWDLAQLPWLCPQRRILTDIASWPLDEPVAFENTTD